jgi:hypothetical protein
MPLPSPSAPPSFSVPPRTEDLYPLTLRTVCLSSAQQAKLETILLTTPVHLRTPTTLIGTLYSDTPKRTISASDVLVTLSTLALSDSTPPRLSCTVETTLEISCTRRCKESPVGDTQSSLLGRFNCDMSESGCGPLPEDCSIWGFEASDFGGDSIIHLA